jgi:hypothetical protein
VPMLLFVVPNVFKRLQPFVAVITMSGIIFINTVFCTTLFQRYIHNPYERKVVSYCDAEKIENGNFVCTGKELKFSSCATLSTSEKRSGRHSAVVSSKNPYCFGVNFPKIKAGDLIEMEVWRKGEGAIMVVAGGSKECKEFSAPYGIYNFEDKNGWKQMHYHYLIPEECKDSLHAAFFVYNFNDNDVYIDDVKLTLYTNTK